MLSTHLMIGEITKPQGIRGEVKVRPVTCDPERFYDLDYVFFKRGETYVKHNVTVICIHNCFNICICFNYYNCK